MTNSATMPEFFYRGGNDVSLSSTADSGSRSEVRRLSLAREYRLRSPRALEARIAKLLGRQSLPSLTADILDVVRFIFVADCRSPRPRSIGQWGRKITVTVPVRMLDSWERPGVASLLADALNSASGDRWEIHFSQLNEPRRAENLSLFEDSAAPSVRRICLLSEGLDSACGLGRRIADLRNSAPDANYISVTALTQSQVYGRVKHTVREINKIWNASVTPVYMPMYRASYKKRRGEEDSQRTRSMLLLGIAAAVANVMGQDEVEVFENGIEMFNFPLSAVFSSEGFSKAMHPVVLARTAKFLSALFGKPFRFIAPFTFDTKGDLYRSATQLIPESVITNTVSCMHWPQRQASYSLCGTCAGCLLRRVAIAAAGGTDPVLSNYRDDVFSDESFAVPVSEQDWPRREDDDPSLKWEPVFQADLRLYRLGTALRSDNPKREFRRLSGLTISQEVELFRAAAQVSGTPIDAVPNKIIELMTRYHAEWQAVRESIPALTRAAGQLIPKGATPTNVQIPTANFQTAMIKKRLRV